MSNTRWRALRRAAAVVAGATTITLVTASAALAFTSGGNPQDDGISVGAPNNILNPPASDQIVWTHNGMDITPSPQGSGDCLSQPTLPGQPGPQPQNTAYLLWVLTTDGGSIASGSTSITISGAGVGIDGTYQPGDGSVGGQDTHFVTPYFDPASSPAPHVVVSMGVTKTGSGSWNLTISHGCAPPTVVKADKPTVDKTATAAYTTTNSWGVSKSVDQNEIDTNPNGTPTFNYTVKVTESQSNGDVSVSGDITVHNTNSLPIDMSGGSVVDQLNGDGNHSCQLTNGPPSQLSAGNTDIPYTCTIPAADFTPGAPLTNKVTVTWTDQMLDPTHHLAAGSASFETPQITPTHNISGPTCVSLSDTRAPDGSLPAQVCESDLTNGTFTKTYPVTYPITNDMIGTCTPFKNIVTIADNGNSLGSDNKTVTVCVGKDLAVQKDATPKLDRTYVWDLTKSAADPTKVNQVGGSATFNYTVKAHHDNGTDSNWRVTGTITVSNPNNWEPVTLTGVTDAIDNGGNGCTITSGDPNATLAPKGSLGDSVSLGYQCTYGSAPSPSSFTNTATAHWSADAAHTADGSADGTATGDFANAKVTIHDGSVTVTDPNYAGGTPPGTLGVANYNDPNNPTLFTYSKSFPVPANGCQSYDNTAHFASTDQGGASGNSNKVTVTVCGPLKTGALTMGYWQNKNGQGIITGGASTASVCNSGTWLRNNFAPFNETALSPTATCAQVGTYVTNVIKAANASGASMNAMLKAQMLSTALDVYFSDPALGGNKINAPAPVGGQTIDLTQICRMIDGSGGTATCSGVYDNVSSAFGGATSLDVNHILAYAASQSNNGGSVWYGQVKATQQLAKNTFDAINNQVAFGA
jgi:hypothetical protein